MSLNWNTSKIKDQSVFANRKETAINDMLIWGTMSLGLDSITAKNLDEWRFRAAVAAEMGKPIGWRGDGLTPNKPFIPTTEELRKRIGLYTNADNLTRKQWLKYAMDCIERHVERELRCAAQEAAQEPPPIVDVPEAVRSDARKLLGMFGKDEGGTTARTVEDDREHGDK